MSQPQPLPRIAPALPDADRSALTLALYHAGAIDAAHYPAGMPHYLVRPGQGRAFRQILWLHGCREGDAYHQDGDSSGNADWRTTEKAES